ncbi:MAG: GerMN domain-containing protein [Candidatus Tumulicola sp.]
MRPSRLVALVVLLAIIVAGTWYYLSHRQPAAAATLTVYYTKIDGAALGTMRVSMRPQQPGESASEHRRNTVLYAAVQAVAGPPGDVAAIRFPPGTRVTGATVSGSTATVDLSKDVERQAGGTFGENGEFKALTYTVTGIPGIDAVKITIEGQTLPALPGGHLELDEPLHRSDF